MTCVQRSTLLLLLLLLLIDCCEIYSEIFADDARLFLHILQSSDYFLLHSGLNELLDWTQRWLLSVNINKCKVMSVGRNADKSYNYNIIDTNNHPIALEHSNQFKDLGVLVDEN